MLALSPHQYFSILPNRSTDVRHHTCAIKAGVSRALEIRIQRRHLIVSLRATAQVARFAWKFATTKSVGDMIRFQSRQTIRSSVHTVRPAAVQWVDHLQKYSLANCAVHFRTAVKSVAAIVYTLILNGVLVAAQFLYENTKRLYEHFIAFVYKIYLYFLTVLGKYLGEVSDLLLVGYSIFYVLLWLWVAYVVVRMVRAFVYNTRAVLSVGRDLSEALTEEIAYEEEMRNSNFVETVQHQLKNTILVGQVQTRVMPNGSIVISPLPKNDSHNNTAPAAKAPAQPPVAAIKNTKKK